MTFISIFIIYFNISQSHALDLPDALNKNHFHYSDPKKAKLGNLLFYDKILSGNKNNSTITGEQYQLYNINWQ